MKTLMFKIPLMLGLCLASISGNAQSWQSAAPDILYGVNNLSLTVPIRVGIGTAVPVAPLHVQNGCVLFDGNTGSTPVSGTGTRMMWVPDKAAFRAGYVVGSEWDNVNIGLYSSAFNSTTTASGESAFAANIETEATGDGSFAANGYTKASNMYAAAFGDGSTASGIASFAMGDHTTASGTYSVASGTNTVASGDASAAFNNTSKATSYGAFAANAAWADGDNSFAMGQAKTTGSKAFAGGHSGVLASGNYSFAYGSSAVASADYSFAALGGQSDGAFSVAIGENCSNGTKTGSICFSDWLAGPPTVVNDVNNQFKARYSGGFVFHSDDFMNEINTLTYKNGNLGVGTLSATEKVDIDGKLKVRNIPQENTATQILVKGTGDVVKYRDLSTLQDQDWLTPTGTIPSSNNVDIHTEGKVGIGTGSGIPNAKLKITDPSCTGLPLLRLSPNSGCGTPGDLLVAENQSGTTEFIVKPTGSVGIGGTSNPLMNLDIHNGDMIFTGGPNLTYRFHNQYFLTNGSFQIDPADGSGTITAAGIVMGSNGNVGIGTNNHATQKLQVAGNIVPDVSCSRDLGSITQRWNNIFLCVAPNISSDARLKSNVKNLEYGINEIKKLRPVSYNLNSNPSDSRNLGLIAQEVKEVIKEIVVVGDDEQKTHAIRYTELIPVLINAIKEQQQMIEELQKKVAVMENGNTGNANGINTHTVTGAALYQNAPNPFGDVTSIGYKLPATYNNAQIMVFDMNGRKLKSYPLSGNGEGNISFSGTELISGMYLYSLVIDGQEIDTKRMVINK